MGPLRSSPTFRVAVLLAVAELVVVGAVLALPGFEAIPVHVGFSGLNDSYANKVEAACLLGGMLVIGGLCWLVLETMRLHSQRPRGYVMAQIVLLIAFGLVGVFQAAQFFSNVLGLNFNTPAFHMATSALLFTGIGAFLGKVPQNPVVGIRTRWSRSSRLAWEKSNQLAGRLMFWTGLTGLAAAPVVAQPLGFRTLVVAILLIAAASVYESWRVWGSDPERAGL